jgi:phospholipid/cholesterol/gamma-HCH transport system substrate-binding protein
VSESTIEEEEARKEFTPPPRSFSIEFWVGLFAIAGIACFSYLAINIGGMRISSAGFYKISAQFVNVAGLKVGSTVEIAGVEIGQVANVQLNSTEAVVTMEIRDEIQIRDDDIAQIRTKGIIGDKYVKISPGGSEDLLLPGGELSDTESAVEFEDIIGKFIHSIESGDKNDE